MALTLNPPGAGALRETVTFQRLSSSPDALGGTVSTWSDLVTVRAAVLPIMKGQEEVIASGLQAVATFQITVRGSSETLAITEADRAVWTRGAKTLNIRLITNPDARDRYLVLLAEVGVAF